MTTVSIREARIHLSELVDAANRGETVVITRHGRTVARLSPPSPAKESFPDLAKFRASLKVKGKPLSQTVRELRDQERY